MMSDRPIDSRTGADGTRPGGPAGAAPAFTPISPNPYIVGNPVRDPAMFFGREAEFELVRSRFRDSAAPSGRPQGGLLLVFCGERRSGKTSILFQILDKRLGPDFVPVLIDMQSMAVGNEIDFLSRVSEEIRVALGADGEHIAPPMFSSDSNHYATFRKFVQAVLRARPHKKIILLFDEYELIEDKIANNQLSQDVLQILASLIENEAVYLIFTGSQHIDKRRRDYWERFLNKSQAKTISFLEHEDAVRLIQKPVDGRVEFADGTVDAICRLTAGQPFYTQAICQHLVDEVNEACARDITLEMVRGVVDGIVNNPLPQMIFLWDGLEHDDKLVLALLAECLPHETTFAGFDDLQRHHRQRRYKLGLDEARIGPTLEKLYTSDMLLREERNKRHHYAFRMDLWRLWIRRQHSVWQVRRELGIPIPRRPFPVAWAVGAGVPVAAAAIIAFWPFPDPRSEPQWIRTVRWWEPGPAPTSTQLAHYDLEPTPRDAAVFVDGKPVPLSLSFGTGTYGLQLDPGVRHTFHFAARGFADSEVVSPGLTGGATWGSSISLRPLFGDVRILTEPANATIRVDGAASGQAPLTVHHLQVAKTHRVEAVLAGFSPAAQEVEVQSDKVVPVTLTLNARQADITFTTEPPDAQIFLDNVPRGMSGQTLTGVPLGKRTFSAARPGYQKRDSNFVVVEDTKQMHIVLNPEPPGFLIIQGDSVADMYVNNVLVKNDAQNSFLQKLAPGAVSVHVALKSGSVRDMNVVIRSGYISVYDYSKGTITQRLP